MILSALLLALLIIGPLPSSIAQPSRLVRRSTLPNSEEAGAWDWFKEINKQAKLSEADDGNELADRAEIAGLMATYRTDPNRASYFYIINEYGDDGLVRQNACEHRSSGRLDYSMLFTVCVDMSMFNRVTDELTFDKMYLFQINYRWVTSQSASPGESILKPTMSSTINKSDNQKDFEIQFQTEPDTMSKPTRITFNDEDCQHNSQMGKTDCLWSPPDSNLRRIKPYSWLPDAW